MPEESSSEYDGLSIEFNSDNTLEVKEDGVVTQTSTWVVVDRNWELFQLEVNPYVTQLGGGVLICDDRVIFNYSFVDGCDNYFAKIE